MIGDDLIGRKVRHGNLVGTVTSVTDRHILVTGRPGMVVAIPIPEHIIAAAAAHQ